MKAHQLIDNQEHQSMRNGQKTELINAQIAQLKLKVKDEHDKYQIAVILNDYLRYPNSQLAEKHRKANKLGELDRDQVVAERNVRETRLRAQCEICGCCGFYIQHQQLNICRDKIIDVNHLGSSTIVFFKNIVNIALLLVVTVVIYSVFSLATNVSIASSSNTNNYLVISLSSKSNSEASDNDKAKDFYLASSWLGVAMVVVWGILFIVFKKQVKQTEVDLNQSTSVSDYSVVIQKMPYGLTIQQVQTQFNQYYDRIKDICQVPFPRFKIEKYNEGKPFYFNEDQFKDQQIMQIHKQSDQLKQEFIQWIKERQQFDQFSSSKEYRTKRFQQFKANVAKKNSKYNQIVTKIRRKLQQKSVSSKTTVFITFQTIEQRNFFVENNNSDILNRIKRVFPCIDQQQRFSAKKDGYEFRGIIIEPAPEPEDIRWGNIGISDCQNFLRRLFTFFITFVFLGISFVIVYALSTVQQKNSSKSYISFLISLVISVINLLIIKVIQFSTSLERPYTMNNFQISLAVKSIIAQLINSIFIPFMVNYYIKSDIYGQSGLTQDIFILGLTNSFLPPIVRFFDPYGIFVQLRGYYYDRPNNKLWIDQYELNRYAEKMQFELGYEYIYPVSLFLFVCFFVSLQPILPFFALLGLFLMYWIQKYSLFNKSQRPVPGTDIVSFTVYQMLYLGAGFYALGSLTWSAFVNDDSFRNALLPNLIAAGIGILIFLFPYGIFVDNTEIYSKKKSYINRRIYFSSEYDRLNPSTAEKAVLEYKEFLAKKKQEVNGTPQLFMLLQNQFGGMSQKNIYKHNNKANDIFGNRDSVTINNLFYNECRNGINPIFLKSFLMPAMKPTQSQILYGSDQKVVNENEEIIYPSLSQSKVKQVKNMNYDNSNRNWKQQSNQNLQDNFRDENYQTNDFKNIFKSSIYLGELKTPPSSQANIPSAPQRRKKP